MSPSPFQEIPEVTPAPTSIPQVNVPLPSFQEIGKQAAEGARAGGLFFGFFDELLAKFGQLLEIFVAFWMDLYAWVGLSIAERLINAEDQASPAMDRLGRAAVKDVFGVDVGAGAFGQRGAAGARKVAAETLGAAVIRGMFGGLGDGTTGPLQPSSAGAERAVTLMVNASMESWLEGWMMEVLSLGELERFGELDDKLVRSLGLGNICSRVMSPAADVLVATPFEWKINKLYRPKLLTPRQAVMAFKRGALDRAKLFEELARQGFSDDRIETFIAEESKHWTLGELDYMVSRGLMERGDAMGELVNQGYSAEQADARLRLAEDQRLDTYRRAVANEAGARFEDHTIDEQVYRRILETSGLPEREQQYSRIVWGIRRELRSRQLTAAQFEAAIAAGLRSFSEYRRFLLDQGYSFDDAQTIELLLLSKTSTQAEVRRARAEAEAERKAAAKRREDEAAKRREQVDGELKTRGVTLAQFERAVKLGLRTLDEYQRFLTTQGYSVDDAVLLSEVIATQLDQAEADTARREEIRRAASVKALNLGELEGAVKRGLLSIDDYTARVIERGFTREDADLLARMLADEIREASAAAEARAAASDRLRERDLSLAIVEQAVRKGLRSIDSYRQFLAAQGFDSEESDTLARLLQLDMDEDAAAREARARIGETPAARAIPLSDLERAVRAGVRSISDYKGRLTASGFSEPDVDALTRLLELDIAQDKATAAARAAAEERASAKRISISDLERAVKLGVVPIAEYDAGLTRAGIVAGDREILRLSLLAEIAATRAAQQRRAEVGSQLKARGLSIAQVERAVREGLSSIDAYRQWLTTGGYSAQDAELLVALLRLSIDEARAAEAKRAEAATVLRTRSISLGDFESAVKAGIRSIADYVKFLHAEGFSTFDVVTLERLLTREIADAAAKLAGE